MGAFWQSYVKVFSKLILAYTIFSYWVVFLSMHSGPKDKILFLINCIALIILWALLCINWTTKPSQVPSILILILFLFVKIDVMMEGRLTHWPPISQTLNSILDQTLNDKFGSFSLDFQGRNLQQLLCPVFTHPPTPCFDSLYI